MQNIDPLKRSDTVNNSVNIKSENSLAIHFLYSLKMGDHWIDFFLRQMIFTAYNYSRREFLSSLSIAK